MDDVHKSYSEDLKQYENYEKDPAMKEVSRISIPLIQAAKDGSLALKEFHEKVGHKVFVEIIKDIMKQEVDVPMIPELFVYNEDYDDLEKEYYEALNNFQREFFLEHIDRFDPKTLMTFICRCIRESCFRINFVELMKLSPLAPPEERQSLLKSEWSNVPPKN